jgi:hypothetical protein
LAAATLGLATAAGAIGEVLACGDLAAVTSEIDERSGRVSDRLCDAADTAMGVAMTARGRLAPITAVQALAITGGATAIELAALAKR